MTEAISFTQFRNEWMQSVQADNPTNVELGRRFAVKIITQWLDVDSDTDDLIYCDGSGDGGIDAAYLHRREAADNDGDLQDTGNTWFLIQSKYGSAFRGTETLLTEAQKLIDTLDGKRTRLSSLAEAVVNRLTTFRSQASDQDRIILVFATEAALDDAQNRALDDIRAMGRGRLGSVFDVDCVSLATIFTRLSETEAEDKRVRVTLNAKLVESGPTLLLGSTQLMELYEFLKRYRRTTQDLDQLYERNVRRFLGGRGKVNKGMQNTLNKRPEHFGLFNNGITITVADYIPVQGGYELVEPYVVNGCQTTRTIWEVCQQKLETGATGTNEELDNWKARLLQGVVVTKIVKVGVDHPDLLSEITRFTNSQNAVKEKDFLTLTSDFHTWKAQMQEKYDIFLEVQRGAWESQKALQKQRPETRQFKACANAFDLLKVYGAGWLGEAGTANGRNAAFLPNGSLFKRIMNGDGESAFGVADLYAAYRLQRSADEFQFGRSAPKDKPARRLSKFIFYMVVIELLRDVMLYAKINRDSTQNITACLLRLFDAKGADALRALLDNAINLVDEYMTQGTDDSVHDEPVLIESYNGDLWSYLKWERFGKDEKVSPKLRSAIAGFRKIMAKGRPGQPSDRELIVTAIRECNDVAD